LLAVVGCKRSFQESQLVGSWQLDVQAADVRFTYYTNHTWVMIITSSENIPSGSEFGEWKLDGDRLTITTRSALDDAATNVRETGKIEKLNNSVLIEKNQDVGGKTKTSAFHRVEMPSASVADSEFTQKLVGTWRYSYTNTTKPTGVLLYSIYRADGNALWHGTIYKESDSLPMPKASGIWRVDRGYLSTTITNIQSNLLQINKESRDQILSITDSQFTYRDEQGIVKKVIRIQ